MDFNENKYLIIFQVYFVDPRNISAVVTKGDASEHVWVTSYKVDFSDDGDTWTSVEDEDGNPIVSN